MDEIIIIIFFLGNIQKDWKYLLRKNFKHCSKFSHQARFEETKDTENLKHACKARCLLLGLGVVASAFHQKW